MRRRRCRLGVAAGALIAVTGVLNTSPGIAQTREFHDGHGDVADGPDLYRARVTYDRDGLTARVKHSPTTFAPDTVDVYLYIDTNPRRSGPEFRVFAVPDSEEADLARVSGFAQEPESPIDCRVMRLNIDAIRPYLFRIPTHCLGQHRKVRVAILAGYEHGDVGSTDWMAREETFLPWVRHG